MNTSFEGELQFRRYSDTSTQGQQIVFAVHGREELESFIGKEGKRFMAVLVEIGDDEQPVTGNPVSEKKPREYLGDLCYRAVQWCNDPEFREWLTTAGDFAIPLDAAGARNVILEWCGISSRKDLDTNLQASAVFRRHIVGPWQKYQMARRSA